MNKVYTIILNYKTWQDTVECIESVLKSDYANYQIIIVDNASSNDSLENIAQWLDGESSHKLSSSEKLEQYILPISQKPIKYKHINEDEINLITVDSEKIILIQANDNKGFSAGNNIGIKFAQRQNDFEYIWFLNNDTVVKPDTLLKLIECKKVNNNQVGIIGSDLLFYHNPEIRQALGGKFCKYSAGFYELGKYTKATSETVQKIDYAIGASMFVSKDFIEKVGLMNENYFLYYEEIDWSVRGRKKNFMTIACPSSIVYHKEGGTTHIKNKKNLAIEYYKYKNLLEFYKTFYKYLIPIAYLRLCIKMIKKTTLGDLDEAKLIFNVILGMKNEI